MPNLQIIARKRRALLTETLPYEVPIVFSNEMLFVSEVRREKLSQDLKTALGKIRPEVTKYTKPLNYKIRKGGSSLNTLSIVHPLHQLKMANFVFLHEQTLINECSKSQNTLRAPHQILPAVTKSAMKKAGKVKKLGIPHIAPSEGVLDLNFAPSYFSLRKYNLLDSFYSSNELLRLESRFPFLLRLDVTKCFFNIYTHSVSWAIKGKEFSKNHAQKYSFEQQFDTLMQRANFNETNGIVVGPEISRVFAEVIFQRIDLNITSALNARFDEDTDYALRRYVDDFFIFAKTEVSLTAIEETINEQLEAYKLYANSAKRQVLPRPFVTDITSAKQSVAALCGDMLKTAEKPLDSDPDDQRKTKAEFRFFLEELRLIVGRTSADFSTISSRIYSDVSKSVKALGVLCSGSVTIDQRADAFARLKSLVRILFYALSSDYRVSPIYRAHQILEEIQSARSHFTDLENAAFQDYLVFEICELLSSRYERKSNDDIDLETSNLLLSAALLQSDLLSHQPVVQEILRDLEARTDIGYFSFITMMFIYGNDPNPSGQKIGELADLVAWTLENSKASFFDDCSAYLLLCDFISCPFVDATLRCNLFERLFPGKLLTKNELEILGKNIGFVDWRGARTSHYLRRKRLQPVYHAV
jgi:hypothetical protein